MGILKRLTANLTDAIGIILFTSIFLFSFEETRSQSNEITDFSVYKIEDPDGWSNLRSNPAGSIIRRVYPNERFFITALKEKHYYVLFPEGEKGFIHVSRVKNAISAPDEVILYFYQCIFDKKYEEAVQYVVDNSGPLTEERKTELIDELKNSELVKIIEDQGLPIEFKANYVEYDSKSIAKVEIEATMKNWPSETDILTARLYEGRWMLEYNQRR